jgi:hypothetical protein
VVSGILILAVGVTLTLVHWYHRYQWCRWFPDPLWCILVHYMCCCVLSEMLGYFAGNGCLLAYVLCYWLAVTPFIWLCWFILDFCRWSCWQGSTLVHWYQWVPVRRGCPSPVSVWDLLVDACAGTLVTVSVLLVCTCTSLVACTMIVYGCTSYWYSIGLCSLASFCVSIAWLVLVLPGWALFAWVVQMRPNWILEWLDKSLDGLERNNWT